MNTSPASPAAGRRSPDDESGDRSDMELDMMFALDPLDEAIDVAFAAVEAAQQAARTIPETAAPAKFRDEWRTHNARGRRRVCAAILGMVSRPGITPGAEECSVGTTSCNGRPGMVNQETIRPREEWCLGAEGSWVLHRWSTKLLSGLWKDVPGAGFGATLCRDA